MFSPMLVCVGGVEVELTNMDVCGEISDCVGEVERADWRLEGWE